MRTYSYRLHYIVGGLLIFIVALLIAARLYLGIWMLHYVNHSLNNIKEYEGSVQSIDIELYRGAYRINGLKLYKKGSGIPTPFINIDTVDLAIEWDTLFHGRIVSNIHLEKPILTFAVKKDAHQNGSEVDWTKPIKALMPIDINLVTFHDGKLTYQDFSSSPQVDIYIHQMSGSVSNLRNVVEKSQPLPSVIEVKGDSIGGGALTIKGRMNILKAVPDMDLTTQLENVHLPALNSYSNAYAALDFKDGTFSVYSELIIKDNQVSGYVKPIAQHISLVDLRKDSNPLKVAWETIATTIITIFTNHNHDQFATKVNLQGTLDNINTDTWSAIGGIIRNAFISALQKGFDPQKDSVKSQNGAGAI